ncbi:MAG TPA: hypothetical protein VII73_12750 [Caulobacteraceae bacterium]
MSAIQQSLKLGEDHTIVTSEADFTFLGASEFAAEQVNLRHDGE